MPGSIIAVVTRGVKRLWPFEQTASGGLVLWSARIALSGTAGIAQISALLALALLQQEQNHPATSLLATHIARRRRKRPAGQPPKRRLSCVVRGRLSLVAALFNAEILPCGRLQAEAWPETITAPRKLPSASALRQRERKREQKRRARARARTAA